MIMKTIFAHNILRELVFDFHAIFGLVLSVAYLECAKGGGPGGLGDFPQWGPGAKPR